MRGAIFKGCRQKNFSVLKVLGQCPLDLLAKVRLREGRGLGSEEGKGQGSGICYDQRKEVEPGLCCSRTKLVLILTF
jgi:hypothetical protein